MKKKPFFFIYISCYGEKHMGSVYHFFCQREFLDKQTQLQSLEDLRNF